jgi:two-component system chemotaxis response regulator CheB
MLNLDTSQPRRLEAIVVGASAGGIEALGCILPLLPSTVAIPVVVVVHLPPRAPSSLVDVFSSRCALPVREPRDKEPASRGIWFGPPDHHLLIEGDRTFALSVDEPVHCSRPSIDVLFESAADVYGPALAGVVLTGASHDGADGARAIRVSGGLVVVQDPATAESTIMPTAAIGRSQPQCVGAPGEIGAFLRDLDLRARE